ncbi:MAG TPA: HAMP domain-containing protein, partial [Steroidobacteraceae bacterium]|nr:HAMP domain-containing protein [Steroidobacteraceae bacterium]
MRSGLALKLLLLPAAATGLLLWVAAVAFDLPGAREQITALLLGWVVIASAWSWWIARQVRRPLSALLTAIRELRANPQSTSSLPVHSADELGDISIAFNDMVLQLRQREADALCAAERVNAVNRDLHGEVQERRQAEAALKRTSEFLQMAQSAGGIALFDLDLRTGLVQGSDLFFQLLQIDVRDRMITQEQWMAS